MKTKASVIILMFGLMVMAQAAVADMFLMPLRVYFTDGDRMKGLTTLNSGKSQAIYRLSFDHKKQLPDGAYLELDTPLNAPYDPSEWLVYSPRQVDLPPQGKQGVRLSLRRPADLPDGEYRVHAVMQRIARDRIENQGEDAKAVARYMMNVGFAVPIIIRKGKYDTTASIQSFNIVPIDLSEKDPRPYARIEILREGKYSSAGLVEAYWTPPGGGEEIRVAEQKGIVIYPEVSLRNARVYFDRPVQGGSLRVVYRGMEADRGIVFDEKTFPVP